MTAAAAVRAAAAAAVLVRRGHERHLWLWQPHSTMQPLRQSRPGMSVPSLAGLRVLCLLLLLVPGLQGNSWESTPAKGVPVLQWIAAAPALLRVLLVVKAALPVTAVKAAVARVPLLTAPAAVGRWVQHNKAQCRTHASNHKARGRHSSRICTARAQAQQTRVKQGAKATTTIRVA
jgi:hypothetical protein